MGNEDVGILLILIWIPVTMLIMCAMPLWPDVDDEERAALTAASETGVGK
jgi:hypothetical protein